MDGRISLSYRSIVNAFIVFHLFAIWSWCLPDDFALRRTFTRPIARYMVGIGIWQGWDMFSPNPRSVNIRVDSEVEFSDGSIVTYEFPQMDKLGFFERYRRERFRKWSNDNLRLDKNRELWVSAARWVAGQHAGGDYPVARVRLYRRWWDIPAPKTKGPLGRIQPPERVDRDFMFYEWLASKETL